MADIRLNKLIKQYNIGLGNLVEFLQSLGAEVEENPNAKVSDVYLPEIQKKFGKDLELKEQADKVDVKLTEILEKSSRKAKDEEEEDDYEPVRETIIKSNNFTDIKRKPEPAAAPEPDGTILFVPED